jgi:uncharacterized protein (DUF1499 family)
MAFPLCSDYVVSWEIAQATSVEEIIMESNPELNEEPAASSSRALIYLVSLGLLLAICAAFLAIGAGLGNGWNWWEFRKGFAILRWAAYLGIAAGLISAAGGLFGLSKGERVSPFIATAGLLISLLVVAIPFSWSTIVKRVPPIHDISTDTENPPGFDAILPLRKNASNPAAYGGPTVAKLQHEAYPDIQPVILSVPMDQAFEQALGAARTMGWQIVDSNMAEGRIEAVATTTWFRFKDDVVIRVSGKDGQSRLDVRSVSRVGRSDVGTNAKRIRTYIKALTKSDR